MTTTVTTTNPRHKGVINVGVLMGHESQNIHIRGRGPADTGRPAEHRHGPTTGATGDHDDKQRVRQDGHRRRCRYARLRSRSAHA
jgi:hypothetical protein